MLEGLAERDLRPFPTPSLARPGFLLFRATAFDFTAAIIISTLFRNDQFVLLSTKIRISINKFVQFVHPFYRGLPRKSTVLSIEFRKSGLPSSDDEGYLRMF